MISIGSDEFINLDFKGLYLALSPFIACTALESNISITGMILKLDII